MAGPWWNDGGILAYDADWAGASNDPIGSISNVASFNTRVGAITLTSGDVTTALGYTPYNATNPTGYQTAANVAAIYAPLASPALTGAPTMPTAAPGTNTTQGATTAFVTAAVVASTAGVASFNTRTGGVTLTGADVTGALSFTPYNATNPSSYQTAAQVATSVAAEASARATSEALLAPKASPNLTGVPTAPTVAATAASGTAQLATTAFVRNGTTTNDDALAGQVGEVITSTFAPGSVGSGTAGSLGLINLTAGDWELSGTVAWVSSGGAAMNTVIMSIGIINNTISGASTILQVAFSTNGSASLWTGPTRLSLAANTAVYLTEQVNFTGGAVTAGGSIRARRAR